MKATELSKINKKIKESSSDTNDFLNTYVKNEDPLLNLLSKYDGTVSEIYLKELDDLSTSLKFSILFSDLTIVNNAPSGINDYQASYWLPGEEGWIDRKLTIPSDLINELGTDPSNFLPCYFHRNNQELYTIFNSYSKLIDADKMLVRPLRGLMNTSTKIFYYVNPNTPNNHWFIQTMKNDQSIIIDNGLNILDQRILFEVTLPYFTEIDVDTLLNIIIDENDLLAGFRHSLKEVIREMSNSPMSTNEIKNDLLNSEIGKINSKFNNIKNIHKLGIIGTVGTFTLSLIIAYANGNLLNSFLPILPTTSFTAFEINYQKNIQKLKDNPMFLLWRISKNPRI